MFIYWEVLIYGFVKSWMLNSLSYEVKWVTENFSCLWLMYHYKDFFWKLLKCSGFVVCASSGENVWFVDGIEESFVLRLNWKSQSFEYIFELILRWHCHKSNNKTPFQDNSDNVIFHGYRFLMLYFDLLWIKSKTNENFWLRIG